MPTYEYRCTRCKKRFEKFQSMSEKPLSKCPHCGGKPERLIGAGAGLIFKGSGFYITDYKKTGSAPAGCDGKGGCSKDSKKGPSSKKSD